MSSSATPQSNCTLGGETSKVSRCQSPGEIRKVQLLFVPLLETQYTLIARTAASILVRLTFLTGQGFEDLLKAVTAIVLSEIGSAEGGIKKTQVKKEILGKCRSQALSDVAEVIYKKTSGRNASGNSLKGSYKQLL